MSKTEKKVFVSSQEDRGILVKFLKDEVRLSFWGEETDSPRDIAFSKKDILEICKHITDNLQDDDYPQETLESSKEYVHNLLNQMNLRNENR